MRQGHWQERQIRREAYEVDALGFLIGKVVIVERIVYEGRTFVDLSPNPSLVKPKWDGTQWIEGVDLSFAQESKIAEFNKRCEQEIEKGFTASNGHFYRCNRDDQINMIGQKDELTADETITTVFWKTEDVGYLSHTRDEWLQVYVEAFQHKKNQLMKYNSLKQQVLTATTHDAIIAINW